MKKSVLLLGVGLCAGIISIGCEVFDPNPTAPVLVQPEEGVTFTDPPLTFEWTTSKKALSYKLYVFADSLLDSVTLINICTGTDTFFEVPDDFFDAVPPGTYYWKAGVETEEFRTLWSEARSFSLDKTIPSVNLDTTYFPYGLDYCWIYDYYNAYYWLESGGEYYDTLTYTVVDSAFDGKIYTFTLSVIGAEDTFETTVKIFGALGPFKSLVPVVPMESSDYGVEIEYHGDTLLMSDDYYQSHEPAGGDGSTGESHRSSRLRGIGKIYSSYSYETVGGGGSGEEIDDRYRLLYFIKGEDTVWKCDECP